MKSSLLCWAVISLIGLAPAFSKGVPTPDQARESKSEQKSFQLRAQIELIQDLVVDSLVIEDHKLVGYHVFSSRDYYPEAFVCALANFRDAGWKARAEVTLNNTKIIIEE